MNTPIFCERKGKDFNNITKRCLKKCNAGEKRSKKTFKCKKLKKTKRICEEENKDFNDFTLKCVKKCKPDYERDKYFTCKKTKKNQLLCDNENKDFNPFSKRCVKKCAENQERDLNFKCIKIKIPAPATENPSINKKDATELIKFITLLEEKGSDYEETGIHYESSSLLESILYEYLTEKYNTNCFLYGYTKEYGWKPLFINIHNNGLLGDDNYLSKYQKYVYKMIKLIMNCIQKIQNTDQEVIIIPMIITYVEGTHSNMMIYRKSLNVLEHYEPHGKKIFSETNINLDIKNIMKIIVNKMNTRNKEHKYRFYKGKIKYISPINICIHNEGFQAIESQLVLSSGIKDIEKGGFCSIWSIFFAELTLINPYLTSKEILENILNCDTINCVNASQKTKNVIRGYLDFMYNKINPIIQNLGISGFETSKNKISKTIIKKITSKIFKNNYKKFIKDKFKNYNKVEMNAYFEEPNSADFESLSPSNVNSNYSRGMLDDI
jgi:hypothetical protein